MNAAAAKLGDAAPFHTRWVRLRRTRPGSSCSATSPAARRDCSTERGTIAQPVPAATQAMMAG